MRLRLWLTHNSRDKTDALVISTNYATRVFDLEKYVSDILLLCGDNELVFVDNYHTSKYNSLARLVLKKLILPKGQHNLREGDILKLLRVQDPKYLVKLAQKRLGLG